MPRGGSGKSMFGGNGTNPAAGNAAAVSKYLKQVNTITTSNKEVKTVDDLQGIIGNFNAIVTSIQATKKILTN